MFINVQIYDGNEEICLGIRRNNYLYEVFCRLGKEGFGNEEREEDRMSRVVLVYIGDYRYYRVFIIEVNYREGITNMQGEFVVFWEGMVEVKVEKFQFLFKFGDFRNLLMCFSLTMLKEILIQILQ